jgi:hypothetical protein
MDSLNHGTSSAKRKPWYAPFVRGVGRDAVVAELKHEDAVDALEASDRFQRGGDARVDLGNLTVDEPRRGFGDQPLKFSAMSERVGVLLTGGDVGGNAQRTHDVSRCVAERRDERLEGQFADAHRGRDRLAAQPAVQMLDDVRRIRVHLEHVAADQLTGMKT